MSNFFKDFDRHPEINFDQSSPSQGYQEPMFYPEDFFPSKDSFSSGQLDNSLSFSNYEPHLVVNLQDSPQHIPTSSTTEEIIYCYDFEDLCISSSPSESDLRQDSSIRAVFKRMIAETGDSESSASTLYLERDPQEVDRSLVMMSQIETHLVFSQESMQEILEGSLEMKFQKTKSQQSKYKNMYSLVEGQARKLLKDYVKQWSVVVEKMKDEKKRKEKASKEKEKEEEKWLKEQFYKFAAIGQELKLIQHEKSETISGLLSKEEKRLLKQRLKCRRFGILSSLPDLVKDAPGAFLKKDDLIECLESKPKSRTQLSMLDFHKKNVKFGLIVSSIAAELLDFHKESQEDMPLSKSALAIMSWLARSPMKIENGKVLMTKATGSHIQEVLQDIHSEVKETAEQFISKAEMKMFEDWRSGKRTSADVDDKDFLIDFESMSSECGKRRNLSKHCEEVIKKKRKRS